MKNFQEYQEYLLAEKKRVEMEAQKQQMAISQMHIKFEQPIADLNSKKQEFLQAQGKAKVTSDLFDDQSSEADENPDLFVGGKKGKKNIKDIMTQSTANAMMVAANRQQPSV